MKKSFSLSVKKPCSENWSNFTPTNSGGFCQSCNKNVVDFTKMTDHQVINYFKNNVSKTCGRFRNGQLKNYQSINSTGYRNLKWVYSSVVSLLLLTINKLGYAQTIPVKQETEQVSYVAASDQKIASPTEHIIKGRVVDEDGEALPGINVLLKGSTVGIVTDIEGYFEFPKKLKAGDVLIFSFIGFDTKEYTVPKKAPEVIEIPMFTMTCDLVMLGAVSVENVYTKSNSGLKNFWFKIKNLF